MTPPSPSRSGVEAYAAYALRAWLARDRPVSARTRRFAQWSAICSFALGMAGQVAYHLMAQAGMARASWAVTSVVSCLPVLGMGPRWRTCSGPTLRLWMHKTAGPDRWPSCGPCPGPPKTRADQAADHQGLTGTDPRGGTRMFPGQVHRKAQGPPGLARGPRSRSWSGPAFSAGGLPQRGSQYHGERCEAAESGAPTRP